MNLENLLSSGFKFNNFELELKSRYQMVNMGILLSIIALSYGIVVNFVKDNILFIPFEILIILMNSIFFILLRKNRKYFEKIVFIMTLSFTLFLLFLVYASTPSDLKHIWLFTYPIVLLYFQGTKKGKYWFSFLIISLLIAPLQPFVEVSYSFYQVTYISLVLIIISIIVFFYYEKIDEANRLILKQQEALESKVKELEHKDELLTRQSKQAVMGEMITMIAHQWRQPLSTITLQISNLQIKRLLEDSFVERESDRIMDEINKTTIYLSNTIDDFQTYFHPDKESSKILLKDLLNKVLTFTLPRVKGTKISLDVEIDEKIELNIYINELIQVLLNLVNNAIDELSSKDYENPRVVISANDLKDCVEILVSDNGGGIKQEALEHLFEPYFSTKGRNGTGLGLYMSQMIIEKQFGGSIDVKTSKNGSTFIIKIPKKV
jgi:signal transduction histidine kinase